MYSNNRSAYGKAYPSKEGTVLDGVFKHSVGITGVFYGIRHESNITLAVNQNPQDSKLFQNIELITKITDEDGLNLPFKTFNQLEIWNDERYTGLIDIVYKDNAFKMPGILEVLSSKVKDVHRLLVSRDIVIDPNVDIFNSSNHAQSKEDSELTKWLPKIRGNFVELKLITNNQYGPLYLFKVQVNVAKNIR